MRKLKPSSPFLKLTLAKAMREVALKYNDRHQLKMADELERLALSEMQLKLPLPEPPAKPPPQEGADETKHVPLTPGKASKPAQPLVANTGIHPGIKLALIIFFGLWGLSFLPCISNGEISECYPRFPRMILSLLAILTVIIAFVASWVIALRLIFLAGKGHEVDDSFLFYFKAHLAMTAGGSSDRHSHSAPGFSGDGLECCDPEIGLSHRRAKIAVAVQLIRPDNSDTDKYFKSPPLCPRRSE